MDVKQLIIQLLDFAKKAVNEVIIIFLASVQDITPNKNDYEDTSILTEFLSLDEYNELLSSLQNFGFYVLTYFDTNKFLVDYLNGLFTSSKLIIVEGSQKGVGRARDAFLPSFCDLENIIHTGPNAYTNSICTNKYHWTKLLENHNISVPDSWRFDNGIWLNNSKPLRNKRLIAKPCYECASIGIHKQSVSEYSIVYEAYLKQMSQKYNQPLIVQEFISGYEVEIPIIIQGRVPYTLPPVVLCKSDTPLMGDSFLDFDDIYEDSYKFCLLKSVNNAWNSTIQEEICRIVDLLELEHYARIDFRISIDGKSYVTDVNSYPHIVQHSSFAYAFERINIPSQNILPCLIGNAFCDKYFKEKE